SEGKPPRLAGASGSKALTTSVGLLLRASPGALAPEWFGHLRTPLLPDRFELMEPGRVRRGQVLGFADVLGEVVQLAGGDPRRVLGGRRSRRTGGGRVVLHQLPVARADGPLLAQAPVERVMRRLPVLAGHIWQQVDAVEPPLRPTLHPGRRQRRRQYIELD